MKSWGIRLVIYGGLLFVVVHFTRIFWDSSLDNQNPFMQGSSSTSILKAPETPPLLQSQDNAKLEKNNVQVMDSSTVAEPIQETVDAAFNSNASASASASSFRPDPKGRLTKEQVTRYMNILQISMSRLGSESELYSNKNKALEAQLKMQSEQKAVTLGSYSHLYYQGLTDISESIDKARKVHAEILLSKNTPIEEYRWIGGRVYQAFLLVANAELKRDSVTAKAEQLKKIEDITTDDYAEIENTYIATFGVENKEAFNKTTPNERLAIYKKSQREEINRMYNDSLYDKPIDTEEIRANGELVRPYKSIFLKATKEYLVMAL